MRNQNIPTEIPPMQTYHIGRVYLSAFLQAFFCPPPTLQQISILLIDYLYRCLSLPIAYAVPSSRPSLSLYLSFTR